MLDAGERVGEAIAEVERECESGAGRNISLGFVGRDETDTAGEQLALQFIG